MRVVERKEFSKLYKLFNMNYYYKSLKDSLHMNCSANEALSQYESVFVSEIMDNNSFGDIAEALNNAIKLPLANQTSLSEICKDTLVVAYQLHIGMDIIKTIVFNEVSYAEDKQVIEQAIEDYFIYDIPYNEATAIVKDKLKTKTIADKLAEQLGIEIGKSFTVRGLRGLYQITKDGIICEGQLISQQQLLHILYGGREIHVKE